ncbi:MAG: hypothetical protein KAJ98_07435, partial [Spirochaetaceae bacterium]|nr:hypothetical protein [Spirochaetaceae bacterium]
MTNMTLKLNWPQSLTRLDAVRNTDPGLYTVALHAFIEGEAGKSLQSTRDMNFRDIIQAWWRDYKDDIAPNLDEEQENDLWAVLVAITKEHSLTNPVRHRFARLAPEEARGVTWNFLRLGNYAGLSALPEAKPLRSSLESWDERASAADDTQLADLKTNFIDLQSRSAELLITRPGIEAKEREILALKRRLLDIEAARAADPLAEPASQAGPGSALSPV